MLFNLRFADVSIPHEKQGSINFLEPAPSLVRSDGRELRGRIIGLTQKEARELGISKSTLHDLRKHARSERSFKVYEKEVFLRAQRARLNCVCGSDGHATLTQAREYAVRHTYGRRSDARHGIHHATDTAAAYA